VLLHAGAHGTHYNYGFALAADLGKPRGRADNNTPSTHCPRRRRAREFWWSVRRGKNRIPANIRGLVAESAEEIVRSMIKKARGGNSHAGAALLRLICSPLRESADPITLDLKKITTPADAAEAISAVISSVTAGQISPDSARDLVGMIGVLSKAYETRDLEIRLSAIETTIKKFKG
jgi:hypothetical protein